MVQEIRIIISADFPNGVSDGEEIGIMKGREDIHDGI